MATNLYDEKSIVTETPREFTRRVPSTYLGSSKKNTNLIKEIFANAVDEHAIGHGDIINVTIDTESNTYTVEDFGQGFLVNAGIDDEGETILQRSFDKLNTSGKTTADGVYQGTALGLNGIGAKLTNWLSKELIVTTYRDGQYEKLWFKDGIFQKREVKKTDHKSGTIVTWKPDEQFFGENVPDETALKSHFEIIAALCPKLTINFEYNGEKIVYNEPGGINAYVEKKVKGKELFSNRFIAERSIGKDTLNICLTYTSDYSENIDAYVNLGHTESGQHITAFHTALVKAINKYATEAGLLKKNDRNFNNAEISEGLYVVCNMTTTTAKYDAQNKSRIDDIDAKIINAVVGGDFATWLTKNPNDARIIIDRALTARKAREAAQKAKEKIRDAGKKVKSIFVDLPSKLSDAYPKNKKDRSNCEVMICLKGDTKIKLLDETTPTIESLVGKTDIWAYSTDNTGAMIPAKIKEVFKTQDVTKTIKITFDDGSVVECTPEHKFLDRDTCTWIEAKDLYVGQSMFSMKTQLSKVGRPKVWVPTKYNSKTGIEHGHWEFVHRRVAEYKNIAHLHSEHPMDIHHVDLNKCNNNPENLIFITKKEHLAIHNRINHDSGRMDYDKKHFTDESRKRMQTAVYRRSDEGIEHQKEAVREAWKKGNYKNATWNSTYNNTVRFKDGKDLTARNKFIKRARAIIDKGLELGEETWDNYDGTKVIKWNNLFSNGWFTSIDELKEEALNYNLKIVSIEEVNYEKPIPVYCLNIDNDFHSFVLDNGIITHNCEGDSAASSINAVKDSSFQATFPIRGKILNCQKATPDKVYANAEISNITKALGLDIDKTTGKLIYDPKKLRYNKIVIACFTGDTKVKSLDGNSYTFKELVDNKIEDLWVYSMDASGNIVPGHAKDIKAISTTNELIEITLDNGETVTCTPDHYLLNTEGEYIKVEDLSINDSLMPLYLNESFDGHVQYFDRVSGKYKLVYELKDARNQLKNEPHNLTANKSNKPILPVDRLFAGKTIKFLEENNLPFDEATYNFYRTVDTVKYSELFPDLFENEQELMKYAHSKDFDISNYKPCHSFEDFTEQTRQRNQIAWVIKQLIEHDLAFNKENYNKLLEQSTCNAASYEFIDKIFDSYEDAYTAGVNFNHSIKSIRKIQVENEPVYCMNVDKYHNFALDSGVFVKNCDSDADGSAIAMLLCTVFNWLCPELFINGHIYRVYGALFKITFPDGTHKLFQNDAEFDEWKAKNPDAKYKVSRAKGLGELTEDEAYEQLVNPATRNLKRLEVSDYDMFTRYLDVFEGEDVTSRKEFYDTGIMPDLQ